MTTQLRLTHQKEQLDSAICIAVIGSDPLRAIITLSKPTFELALRVEAWLTDKGVRLTSESSKDRSLGGSILFRAWRVELCEDDIEDFIKFASTLCEVYALDTYFDKEVTAMRTPSGKFIAFAHTWTESD